MRQDLPALTSLRFFAAAMIVAAHANETIFTARDWGPLASGVTFFFVLSGFILFHVYGETTERGKVRKFLLARLARVWPMHIATVFMFMVLMKPHFHLPGWSITLSNATLIQSWIPLPRYNFSFNGVAWSISTELAFYLLFPFLSYRLPQTWHWKLIISAGLLIFIIALCQLAHIGAYDPSINTVSTFTLLYTNPVSRTLEFVSGMVIYLMFAKLRKLNISISLASIIEISLITSIATAIIFWRPIYDLASRISIPFAEWQKFSGVFPLFCALVLTFAIGRGYISSLLRHKTIVFLGEASFSLYMVHQLLNHFWVHHFSRLMQDHPATFFLSYLFFTILISVAAYQFIEKPSRKFILRFNLKQLSSKSPTEVRN